MRRALVLGLLVLGCGGVRKVGGQPRWRKVETKPTIGSSSQRGVTFEPTSAATAAYNDPPFEAAPTSDIDDALVAAVDQAAKDAGLDPPIADGRLYAAASDIAEVIPDEGVVAYPLVEFALQHHGIIEPSPHLLVIWGPLDDPPAIVDQLKGKLGDLLGGDARLRLGIGTTTDAHGDGKVVVALQPYAVTTDAIPRELPDGGSVRIKGAVAAPFAEPEIFVTHADGTVTRPHADVTGAPRSFDAQVDCADHAGRMQIEIAAADTSGSTVLANFPVWCHQRAPTSITMGDAAAGAVASTEGEAEQQMFTLLNQDRAANGLPALAWDERAATVARGHSTEMKQTGEVAHISPTTGTAADRVKAGGIKTAAVLENIARAYGVSEAEEGLMNSPGHRANLLSGDVTHVGIGIVFGDEIAGQREMFVTQVFIRIVPQIDPAKVTEQVRDQITAVKSLDSDAELDRVAQDLADAIASGQDRKAATAAAGKALEPLGQRYARVGSVVTTVADLGALDANAMVGDSVATTMGIGVAQGTSDEMGEGAIFIVLLLAVAR